MPRTSKPALTDAQKMRIKNLYKREVMTQLELAERFGVTQRRISQILKEKNTV